MNDDWRIPGRPIPQAADRDWTQATIAERLDEVERLRREYWGDDYPTKIAPVFRVWQKDEQGEWKIVKGNF